MLSARHLNSVRCMLYKVSAALNDERFVGVCALNEIMGKWKNLDLGLELAEKTWVGKIGKVID